jgi:hypothetical protein
MLFVCSKDKEDTKTDTHTQVKSAERTMLFVCSDGLFSKHAFPSLARVISFLIDPEVWMFVCVFVCVCVCVCARCVCLCLSVSVFVFLSLGLSLSRARALSL